MRKIAISAMLLVCGMVSAQQISFLSDGKLLPIEKGQTQTQIKPGLKIQDIQLKSKTQRYIWGQHAAALADSNTPEFVVDTDTLLLSNLTLLKLSTKAQYRKIPKAVLSENKLTFVDLNNFSINPYGEEGFHIKPLVPLEPGDYIFTWSNAPTIGSLEDWYVWPFTVK